MKHQAIIAIYPQVKVIRGDDAFDIDNNPIEYDEALVQAYIYANSYKAKREQEYPLMTDYLDGVVKGDQVQIDAYISACLAVKAKYPKG